MTPPIILNPGTDLPFPTSLPEFMRLFPDDAACAKYLENIRWMSGFVCPYCRVSARFAIYGREMTGARPGGHRPDRPD